MKFRDALLVLLLTGGIAGAPPAQTPPVGLVAAYSFDEGSGPSVNDGSGNNHTGTISSATWASAGKYGGALSFNGSGSWVTVANSATLNLTIGMTLEAWVFPTSTSGVRDIVIKEGSNVDIYNLYARNWRGLPESNVLVGGTNRTAEGSALPANVWTHVAGTYDGTTLRLYINGVQAASTAISGSIATSTGPLRIGGNSLWGEFFQGLIDEVRIYSRALSQAEIQTDMAIPIGSAPPPPPPPGPDQVGQWSNVIPWPIVPIHMSYLTTGEVLSWDGFGFAPGSATLWNPATGQFAPVPNGPNLFCSGHILMPDGRLLVLGGHLEVYVGITSTTIYDPATRSWSAAAPMNFPRWYPTVTGLPDGRALVMSGNTSCQTCIADTPEIYDPATNSWSRLNSARLGIPPYPYNFVLPNGKVLVAGGYHDSMPTRVLDIASQAWQVVDSTQLDAGSAVMYAPGKILKSGSSWESEPAVVLSAATTYVMDANQASPTWRSTALMAYPRVFHNLTVLPDGNVLVTGGGQTTDLFNLEAASLAAEMWSPATERWTTMASAQVPRFYHSAALLLRDGRVLVAGGGRAGVDQLSAEIFSPPYLFKGSRPIISASPLAIQYGASFSVQTPDAARIAKVSLIALGSVTHTFDMNQRFVPLSFQTLSDSLDIQAPANSNLAPPGYYMMFIVDSGGIPSVAELVRLPTAAQDVESPTVSITSPSAGQSVSGNITVSASATDNVGVVGVQFKVDGNNIGAEDSTNPYSVSWNTTTVSNGNHILTAVARDGAGNTTVSSAVTVSVSNVDITPPSIPTGVSATAVSATQVNVTWGASTDNIGVTGYRVFRDGLLIANATTTSYSDINLQPSTTYAYTIAALDAAGNVSSQSSPPVVVTTLASSPPALGLIAAYGFNEAAGTVTADATGKGHTGAISNATWTTGGKYGAALSFNGSNSWVTVVDANDLDLTTGMTLEAWVFPTVTNGVRDILIKEGSSVDIYNLYARNGQGLPEANVFVGGANRIAQGTALPANAWSHVAGTYDGTTLRLFINGVQVASTAISGSIAASTGPLRIGGNSMWGEFFQGLIDEVRIYNRALTQAEIQSDMITPIGGTSSDTTPPVASNGAPTGTLAAGTTQATLSLATNENATCRYATTAGVAYNSMPNTFTTTGGTAHSTTVSGLSNGGNYSFYVRCRDVAGNASTGDFTISFSVALAPTAGLVAAFSFNEGGGTIVVDASGNGHTGTISGAVWTTQGRFGNALSFNGINEWVTVNATSLLNLTTGMTLEAWVFPTATTGVRDILVKEGPGVDIYNLYARNGQGRPEANILVGGKNRLARGTALPVNTWTHVAGTYDGKTLRLFINGVQAASANASGSIATSTGPLRIGGNSIWGEYFQGRIDEIRIYNRALSQAEIQSDMSTPIGP